MPCYHPLEAYQRSSGGKLTFRVPGDLGRTVQVACGQCVGCRLERSRQWAVRCVHEAQLHRDNCFVTLTYDDAHLPDKGSLRHSDFQRFMKRLRHHFPMVRFYMCGEYGDNFGRPHFHAILFGVDFHDRLIYKRSGEFAIYSSRLLSSVWTDGFASVADFSFDTAAYVARYVMKKITGDMADDHYRRTDLDTGEVYWLTPEYNRMSLKPGIGADWFRKYHRQVHPRDYIVINGRKSGVPRYYDTLLSRYDRFTLDYVKRLRVEMASQFQVDQTPVRLAAREAVAKARLSFKQRSLK